MESYLQSLKEALDTGDYEAFGELYFTGRQHSDLPGCVAMVLETVSEEAEFVTAVDEARNLGGLKEVLENLWDEEGDNLLEDKEGRLPDIQPMPLRFLKAALEERFGTSELRGAKEAIITGYLFPKIAEMLREGFKKECDGGTLEALRRSGWTN